jgi:uncharacterized spore protein YtfJ
MSNALENLKMLLSKVESHVNAQTVIGEPVTFGDVTLVPLVDVCINMGSGLSNKTNGGTNGKDSGGGVVRANMSPAAVIVINNGTVQLLDIKSEGSVNKFVDMIPGLLNIVKTMYNSHKEKEEKAEKAEKMNKQQFEVNEIQEEPDVTIVVED